LRVAPADFATPYEPEPAVRERPSLLAILRRRWLIVLIVPILTGAAAAALAYTNDRDYESTAKLRFSQTIGPAINATGVLPNSPDADNLATSNKDAVGSRDVADDTSVALAERGVDMSGEDISEDVSVTTEKDSDVVTLAAQGSSPERAQLLASTYAATAAENLSGQQQVQARRALRITRQTLIGLPRRERKFSSARLRDHMNRLKILAAGGGNSPTIIQSGFLPTARSGNPVRTILLGVLFGIVLGIGLALLREQADRRLHASSDVSAAFDARVLTTVPRNRKLKRRVPFDALPAHVAEAFRMLVVNLRFSPGERPRTVLVTSSRSSEGKTTVAWYLASAAAANGMRVALVEADLRRPALAKRFGLDPSPGLAEALGGSVSVADALQTPRQWAERDSGQGGGQLEVLVAGTPSSDSWVLMQSGVMDRTLEILTQRNDLVVLDTPPIPHVADAVSLLRRVDGVIITASVSSTKSPEAARLRDELETFHARILGVVANGGSAVGGYAYSPVAMRAGTATSGGGQASNGSGAEAGEPVGSSRDRTAG
jgi:capsular exopolysaccharide synthesis family protein